MEMVFDSSTLILLAKTDLLGIIAEDIQIIIPKEVKIECTRKDVFDAKLIAAFINDGRIEVSAAPNVTADKLKMDFKIHIGEAEALALALKRNVPLAVDDWPTIKACKILNLRFATAIHFLIKMHQKGKIGKDTASVKLEKLSLYGRYNRRIIEHAAEMLKGGG